MLPPTRNASVANADSAMRSLASHAKRCTQVNDVATDRRLRAHRRLPRRSSREQSRLHRLALLAALRFGGVLRGAPGNRGARPLVDRSTRPRRQDDAALPALHTDPGNAARDGRRSGADRRLHVPWRGRSESRPYRRRRARGSANAHGARLQDGIREDRSLGASSRRCARSHRGTRSLPARLAASGAGGRAQDRGGLHRASRRRPSPGRNGRHAAPNTGLTPRSSAGRSSR